MPRDPGRAASGVRRVTPGSSAHFTLVEPGPELATHLLADFLAVVSSFPTAEEALAAAVRHAAAALEAEVAAVVTDGAVSCCWPDDAMPHATLAAVVTGAPATLELPGVGPTAVLAIPLSGADGGADGGRLVIGRVGAGFNTGEVNLLRGMARAIELTVEMLSTLDAERRLRVQSDEQANENATLLASLRERQRLMEKLSVIQRMISRREPLDDILDAIVSGGRELLGSDVVMLRHTEGLSPAPPRVVARCGGSERIASWLARVPMPDRLAPGEPLLPDDVVHHYEFPSVETTAVRTKVRSAIATPVHENGTVIGSLVAASYAEGRRYTDAERATLLALAEHVSLAVTDANTLEAMYRAFHDSLTGLASRALFLDRLQHELAQASRSATNITLLFVDLDRFKMVNDTLGHSAGDALLVEIAERLRDCLRASDTAARFGGDEFVVLLHATNAADAEIVADRIIDAVRRPFCLNGLDVVVDASIGIACSEAGAVSADDLLRDADVAMYRAKRSGRGRHATFEPEMHAALVERLQLEAELRNAVEHGEMAVHYQPIVSLATGDVTGVEALLRWNHPVRGLMVAEEFVAIAEECGAMPQIGGFALRNACERVSGWQRERSAPISVSVNISATQLEQPQLCADVAAALSDSGLPASSLVLEVTEALVLREEPWVMKRLDELKALGVRLAIDDFGAGYSSLVALRDMPIDIVKIDQSFIEAIGTVPDGAEFARKIVELGHTLDLVVVAEGVQSRAQFDVLRRARCELGQGFLFAEPTLADRLPTARRLRR